MIFRALKFVPYRSIQDHLCLGWIVAFGNGPMHHHHYGIEMAWICGCPIPGERQ